MKIIKVILKKIAQFRSLLAIYYRASGGSSDKLGDKFVPLLKPEHSLFYQRGPCMLRAVLKRDMLAPLGLERAKERRKVTSVHCSYLT